MPTVWVRYCRSGATILADMPSSADVVVIGAGIHGLCAAWQLALKGAGRVVVLDRSVVAGGASGRTGALLRRHYSNEPEARLAQLGYEVYDDWTERVGGDCGRVRHGLVVTVDNGPGHEANVEHMRRNVAMQNRLGIDSRVISAENLRELQPFAHVDDIQVAAYEPETGYVDAVAATRSMAAAAMRAGAAVHEGATVARIEVEADRVTGVRLRDREIAAGAVVVAAGPWSTELLETAGVKLPVTALRVQVTIVQRPLVLEEPHFVMIDVAAGMFARPWGPGRSLVGIAAGDQHDPVDPNRYDEGNDPGFASETIAAVARRIPAMALARYLHGHAALYDMSPDAHPIIGQTGVEGLYVAAGFSGAGFKKAPAVGQCLAELIVDGRPALADLTPFRLSRFDEPNWDRPWSDTEYTTASDFGHKF
jgi:sarcosine oxidase subunit beta